MHIENAYCSMLLVLDSGPEDIEIEITERVLRILNES